MGMVMLGLIDGNTLLFCVSGAHVIGVQVANCDLRFYLKHLLMVFNGLDIEIIGFEIVEITNVLTEIGLVIAGQPES